jgi:hypothetical protein
MFLGLGRTPEGTPEDQGQLKAYWHDAKLQAALVRQTVANTNQLLKFYFKPAKKLTAQ